MRAGVPMPEAGAAALGYRQAAEGSWRRLECSPSPNEVSLSFGLLLWSS